MALSFKLIAPIPAGFKTPANILKPKRLSNKADPWPKPESHPKHRNQTNYYLTISTN